MRDAQDPLAQRGVKLRLAADPAAGLPNGRDGQHTMAAFMAVASRQPSLLVVDDEPELAELIAEFARRAGYDVTLHVEP